MVVLDGCDAGIIGYTESGLVAYGYEQLVKVFMDQGMDRDGAVEWIDYNVIPLGPIVEIVYPGDRETVDVMADWAMDDD